MGNRQMSPRDAELAVIGCILSGAKADLAASDFGTPQLQTAWEAAQRMTLAGRPIDLITLHHGTGEVITQTLLDSQPVGCIS
ncbi:MAG: hypothetical protein GX858_03960 [Clostridiales bacterium]|nr:hypothetical protein [Clostridiales bacterium]